MCDYDDDVQRASYKRRKTFKNLFISQRSVQSGAELRELYFSLALQRLSSVFKLCVELSTPTPTALSGAAMKGQLLLPFPLSKAAKLKSTYSATTHQKYARWIFAFDMNG